MSTVITRPAPTATDPGRRTRKPLAQLAARKPDPRPSRFLPKTGDIPVAGFNSSV